MANKRAHGERNQKLSEELLVGGFYFDWSITTGFYSAIHFVEDKIFPLEVKSIHCANINEARRVLGVKGRHQTREDLVALSIPKVHYAYKWLDDQSRNARYKTYKVNKGLAEKAKQYLTIIHQECSK